MNEAMQLELINANKCSEDQLQRNAAPIVIQDLFRTVRRIILRTIIGDMIDSKFIERYNHKFYSDTIDDNNDQHHQRKQQQQQRPNRRKGDDFISEFIIFQDEVEECTAKAAVCPEWLAKPLFLSQCKSNRVSLVDRIAEVLKDLMLDLETGDCCW